ncbi:hypothetical protein [Tropicimonas sediminicola]|uniref:Flp pilus assembly protein, pilin Flp n=1 Tax=Tropicimonas sediminicola TaxID=1031541 RepID=A0A239KKU6_9RHOB|nr:hypothetical protein [Tropicimonas sediminicola]SNT18219.1 hypothetical protein SAMN05421757_107155 [Tropicimonas sediminicola]
MIRLIQRFLKTEDGAVTLDWIVLTAGAIALALGATSMILDGTQTQTGTLATTISERPVGN